MRTLNSSRGEGNCPDCGEARIWIEGQAVPVRGRARIGGPRGAVLVSVGCPRNVKPVVAVAALRALAGAIEKSAAALKGVA